MPPFHPSYLLAHADRQKLVLGIHQARHEDVGCRFRSGAPRSAKLRRGGSLCASTSSDYEASTGADRTHPATPLGSSRLLAARPCARLLFTPSVRELPCASRRRSLGAQDTRVIRARLRAERESGSPEERFCYRRQASTTAREVWVLSGPVAGRRFALADSFAASWRGSPHRAGRARSPLISPGAIRNARPLLEVLEESGEVRFLLTARGRSATPHLAIIRPCNARRAGAVAARRAGLLSPSPMFERCRATVSRSPISPSRRTRNLRSAALRSGSRIIAGQPRA